MRRGIAGKMLLTALMLCLLLSGLTVSGAENLFDPENAFDGLYMTEIADRPGVFTNSSADEGISTGKETFYLPGLTPNYTFSGHIKIMDIGSEGYTGVRLIIGDDMTEHCSLMITKEWGVRFYFKAFTMNDQLWDDAQLRLAKDTEFDFEVIREGRQVTLKLNGAAQGTIEIPEEYDAFDEENDFNLGFEASKCWFEVSDIAVYCEEAEVKATPTAAPAETAAPSEPADATEEPAPSNTTAPNRATEVPKATEAPAEEEDGLSPVVIVVCVVAAAAVIAVIVVLVRKKK